MTKYSVNRKYAIPNFENFDIGILETDDPIKALLKCDKKADEYKQLLEEEKNKQEELKEPFGDRVGPKPTSFGKKSAPY